MYIHKSQGFNGVETWWNAVPANISEPEQSVYFLAQIAPKRGFGITNPKKIFRGGATPPASTRSTATRRARGRKLPRCWDLGLGNRSPKSKFTTTPLTNTQHMRTHHRRLCNRTYKPQNKKRVGSRTSVDASSGKSPLSIHPLSRSTWKHLVQPGPTECNSYDTCPLLPASPSVAYTRYTRRLLATECSILVW